MAIFLIIDDSRLMRKQLGQALRREDHSVLEAVDAVQGMDLATKHADEIDVIVCDYSMPGKNGVELISDMRRMKSLVNKKILMLTTETNDAIRKESAHLNILSWMIKPFNSEKFLSALETILKN